MEVQTRKVAIYCTKTNQKYFKIIKIDSKIYQIGHKDIRGCFDCRKCSRIGKCVFNDEVNTFVEKAKEYMEYSANLFTTEMLILHLAIS